MLWVALALLAAAITTTIDILVRRNKTSKAEPNGYDPNQGYYPNQNYYPNQDNYPNQEYYPAEGDDPTRVVYKEPEIDPYDRTMSANDLYDNPTMSANDNSMYNDNFDGGR